MVKSGFSLIELMIGLFIASLIAVGLYNTFFLTNRVVEKADSLIDISRTIAIVYNQLDKDLSGAILPAQDNKKAASSADQTKSPYDPLFNITKKNEIVETITFLTHNPLAAFQAGQLVQKKRFVRVVYRLVADDQPDSFKLLRQESPNLDLKAFDLKENKVRAYQIARNIKSMNVQWPLKNEVDANKPLYQFATIIIELWNNDFHQRSISTTMKFEIPSFMDMARQLEETKKAEAKKSNVESDKSNDKTVNQKVGQKKENVGKAVQANAGARQALNRIHEMIHNILIEIPDLPV